MDNKHIFIATPMYGGQCFGYFAQSLLQANNIIPQSGVTLSYSFLFNESLIQRARNLLAHQFLQSKATHMMFIDADIKFNPADLLTMLAADKDIICGIYPKKEINWHTVKNAALEGKEDLQKYTGSFVVNLLNNDASLTVPVDQPCEVSAIGTGFMLIKRDVFEKLKPHTEKYVSDMSHLAGEEIYGFYLDPIDPESKRLLSEDYFFCHQWRKIGGKVHAAPWCNLGHMGTYLFEGGLLSND